MILVCVGNSRPEPSQFWQLHWESENVVDLFFQLFLLPQSKLIRTQAHDIEMWTFAFEKKWEIKKSWGKTIKQYFGNGALMGILFGMVILDLQQIQASGLWDTKFPMHLMCFTKHPVQGVQAPRYSHSTCVTIVSSGGFSVSTSVGVVKTQGSFIGHRTPNNALLRGNSLQFTIHSIRLHCLIPPNGYRNWMIPETFQSQNSSIPTSFYKHICKKTDFLEIHPNEKTSSNQPTPRPLKFRHKRPSEPCDVDCALLSEWHHFDAPCVSRRWTAWRPIFSPRNHRFWGALGFLSFVT